MCSAEPKCYTSEKFKTFGDLTNKEVTSTIDIADMQEKIKDAEYIIEKIHVKPINAALNYVKKPSKNC